MTNTEQPTTRTYLCLDCGRTIGYPSDLCARCEDVLYPMHPEDEPDYDLGLDALPYDIGNAYMYQDDPYVDWIEPDDAFYHYG